MIQRIQSLWLFLASMIAGLLFIFPLFAYTKADAPAVPFHEGVAAYYPLLLLAAVLTALPLVTIFLFANRKRQVGMIWLNLIAVAGFLGLMFIHLAALKNNGHPDANYAIVGPLFPILSAVFLFLAMRGIRKDEKLIKSLDRLR